MKKIKNFARFFALYNQIPNADQGLKEEYIGTFTGGRTTSLREMSIEEYNKMCDSIEAAVGNKPANDFTAEIRRQRSAVLKRIGKLGIDTSNWEAVDNFCLNARIAGKLFRQMNIQELRTLVPKLEAIARKDTIKSATSPDPRLITIHFNDLEGLIQRAANQIPS